MASYSIACVTKLCTLVYLGSLLDPLVKLLHGVTVDLVHSKCIRHDAHVVGVPCIQLANE